jgi:hypothetical protein
VVWEVLTDLPRYGEWNPFLPECRTTFKPGDPIDLQVKLMAKPQAQREWITEFVAGSRFAYRMKPVPLGALSSKRSHEVEARGPNRTRYRSSFQLMGWMMPLVRALLGRKLEAGFAGMNEGVQRRAESLWAQRQSTGSS